MDATDRHKILLVFYFINEEQNKRQKNIESIKGNQITISLILLFERIIKKKHIEGARVNK